MSGTSSVGDSGLVKSSSKSILLTNTHDSFSSQLITTHKLNGENYLQWCQSVMLFIRGRGKIGFLMGVTKKLEEGLRSIEIWKSDSTLIISWLINSMEPSISKIYITLWQELDLFYDFEWHCPQDITIFKKMIEKECVFAFLADLNNELDEVSGRIIGREVLPSTREVFSKVRREENKRSVMLGKETQEASITETF
ncbi:hypothetical protein FEM48_Zijuj01G0180200 [Ziziphus jujuba var. spinosa]|uniref:Retrotransposon Copia-like N-terminal domain-containing protein n=1 Tax=Ziziphus jujuba var. spinosa TaxID=714518 RepID=A0A978W2R4_ZIZJJ|nr:hypothetical protein FEM48_Zijuj01G0180200 [Ziziphus jujuba var. spinosa]